jgi:hypothetical protein
MACVGQGRASVAASGEWEASLADERNGLAGRLLNAYF